MKYFFRNPYRALEKQLGYSFGDKDLLATALLHPSFRFETRGVKVDNQRLEFLGDAALGLIASAYLFQTFPELQEGALTCLRSRLTSGKALAKIGQTSGLGRQIKLGKGEEQTGGHQRPSNIADAMEAILGAAYLDGGLKAVRKIFIKLFMAEIEVRPDDTWSDNPKGQLQAVAQRKWKANPSYRVISQEGPAHAQRFTVDVLVNGQRSGTGHGRTKQEAEQQAARHALQALHGNK